MNDVEKVIHGRKALTAYYKTIKVKGMKTVSDKERMVSKIAETGMTLDEFFNFNFAMNMKEADRCYRYRRVDDENTIALCDMCIGRSVVPCFVEACVSDYLDPFAGLVPDSNIVREKTEEANRLGVLVPNIPSVASVYMTADTEGTYAPYCIGKTVKIIEPDFDIFYRMDELIKFGKFRHQEMLKANGVI